MRRLTPAAGPTSARTRLVAGLLLLATCALSLELVFAARLLGARVDATLARELEHEGTKLRAFAARGVDPTTGDRFPSTAAMLDSFLRENVPDEDETFFSVVDGRPASRSPQTPPLRVDLDARFVQAAAQAREPASGWLDTSAGRVRYAVFPVAAGAEAAGGTALVVAQFAAPGHDEAFSTVRLLAGVGLAALLVAALIAWFVAGRMLAPVRLLGDSARRVGAGDLSERVPVTGTDEVAQLAQTFNEMVDRLETAFAGQRAFLDEAGHELRTPLTVVRGHFELMEGESGEEREATRALVLDELDRMGRLVDDLLLLARSERPGFVRVGPVDLADLVMDVLAKAGALGPRRWQLDAVPEGVVEADGERLTQALLQLAANAVRHTPQGAEIGIGAVIDDSGARLWVRDTGEGIDASRHAALFDRHGARTRDPQSDGLGIGLVIVARIAAAHGGTVRVQSAPGVGSRFSLCLPGPSRA